ncbi:TetR/AcrR family transcriptional regulator [Thermocatellispora tengchongensis]|uniref:TetR/AcrR family transcriptional regulator n=1 Tax=Thermocatellispora tengchongensis TaxID=1073253 RepID=UPI00363913B4
MARNPGGRSGSWEWSRTAQTRTGMLRAAREVFVEHGFAEASVADVVERAGSSVGSLYHHFGGKTELFLTLWEEHQVAQEQAAASSVAKAKQEGVTSPVELFIAGARAFLEGSWERRDLVRLFMDGDGPPGFELMRRTRGREWVRQNAVPARHGGPAAGPADRRRADHGDRRGGPRGRHVRDRGGGAGGHGRRHRHHPPLRPAAGRRGAVTLYHLGA